MLNICIFLFFQMKRLNITITGKVQQVGFRFNALRTARMFHINGIVRNSGFDRVYIEAEGTHEDLDQFLKWCSKGPLGAQIDKVEVVEDILKHYVGFEILSSNSGIC
ncbi:MAG: acylphosphatase [Alphaproteobacteria bacterium]|nr:acylphosphatase [Alphaproteobacteria bacterium]